MQIVSTYMFSHTNAASATAPRQGLHYYRSADHDPYLIRHRRIRIVNKPSNCAGSSPVHDGGRVDGKETSGHKRHPTASASCPYADPDGTGQDLGRSARGA